MTETRNLVTEMLYRLNVGVSPEPELLRAAFDELLRYAPESTRDSHLLAFLTAVTLNQPQVEHIVALLRTVFALDGFSPEHRPRPAVPNNAPLISVAGSGKKGVKTINISTPAAFVAASCGVYVAKSGSSSTSSLTGSSEFMRGVGAIIDVPTNVMTSLLQGVGFGFYRIESLLPRFDAAYGGRFYVPHALSFGLAALAIPVRTDALLYGLAHPNVSLSVRVLREFGISHAMVFSSTDDSIHFLDEVGVYGSTQLIGMQNGIIGPLKEFRPQEQISDFPIYSSGHITQAQTQSDNIACSVLALAGRGQVAHEDFVCLNAGNMLYLANMVPDIRDGFRVAKQAVRSGNALAKLYEFVTSSGGSSANLDAILAS